MVFSIAFDRQVAERIGGSGLNVALMDECGLRFMAQDRLFALEEQDREKLGCCENYDVLIINEWGKGYQHFANENDDNPLVLTQKCNSNCIMCPTPEAMRRRDDDTSMDMLIESVRYIPTDARHLTITGGEPFLAGEKIFTLFSEIKCRLPRTECLLLTNGRALGYTAYAERFAATAPQSIVVGIPLHGHHAGLHDAITRSPGGFSQTVAGIRNLIRYGFQVEIRIVVSRLNAAHLTDIARLIVSEFHTLHSVKIMGLEMTGNASRNAEQVWIPYREAFLRSKEAILFLVRHGINVGLYNFPLCAVDTDCHLLCRKSITGYKIRFAQACEQCLKQPSCGGIFAGSARYALQDVKPWLKHND